MKLLALFQQQSRRAIFGQALLVALLIGILDFLSGYEVSVSVFYGVPILAVAWWCDRKSALLLAITCAIIWWWADFEAGHRYTRPWFVIWESSTRFGYFAIIAVGGSSLRKQQDAARSRILLLEHSQRLEREIIDISEREQRRIGRDLHDGLCQYFAAIGCAAASLKRDLADLGLPNEAAVADELTDLLNEGVVQTRDLARGLVPVQMDEAGLGSALVELAAAVSRLQAIACLFVTDGETKIGTPSAATHLYRIAQEAVNNATRHGGAKNIRIELRTTAHMTTLHIADDGTGISRTNQDSRGMGLNIMSYRARLIGGHLTVSERRDHGTIVSCTFPQSTRIAQEHGQAL